MLLCMIGSLQVNIAIIPNALRVSVAALLLAMVRHMHSLNDPNSTGMYNILSLLFSNCSISFLLGFL